MGALVLSSLKGDLLHLTQVQIDTMFDGIAAHVFLHWTF